jgi:hypothetical protein
VDAFEVIAAQALASDCYAAGAAGREPIGQVGRDGVIGRGKCAGLYDPVAAQQKT